MVGYAAAAGLAVAALLHKTAEDNKWRKAILAGLVTWPILAYLRKMSRRVLGFEREKGYIEEWAEQYEEDAIEPDLRIVDAHHHLWDWMTQPRLPPGLMPKPIAFLVLRMTPKTINRLFADDKVTTNTMGARIPVCAPYMGPELVRDIKGNGRGHNVVGTIFIECGWHAEVKEECMKPAGEVDAMMEVNRQHPGIVQGIIAHADLTLGKEVEPLLKLYSANPMVKGIRDALACPRDDSISADATPDKGYDTKFREGFALLQKYNLTYDSWHFHVDLDSFTDLAKSFPQQTMICDHMAFPLGIGKYDKEATFPEWKTKMTELAKYNNVYVKIGGFGMRFPGFGFDERPKPPTSDELAAAWAPYVKHTIDAFGVDRCIMESNFPMDKISCSYTVLFNALKKIVKDYSQEDKQKLFELNALRVYQLTLT